MQLLIAAHPQPPSRAPSGNHPFTEPSFTVLGGLDMYVGMYVRFLPSGILPPAVLV